MIRYAILPIFTLFSAILTAQNTQALPIICGNEILNSIAKKHYPQWHEAIEKTFEKTQQQKTGAANRSQVTINVVVHIVWKNAAENLHDSIILNQMEILNRDFNRKNADSVNLRSIFHPVAGNPEIKFNLAQIVRKQTSATFSIDLLGGSLLPELKHTAAGGSDAWDTEKYLNIWICQIQPTTIFGIPVGQILGFAFPPDGLNNWPAGSTAPTPAEDGVVIDFRAIGSNNPNTMANPNGQGNLIVKGRTAVHEVGHYLGLRHIWGDGGLLGPNDCAQSDGIDDTPFAAAQSEFDCDTTKNSCEVVEIFYTTDMPDLIENYMDYSSELCMNMFTKGQATHVRATLEGPRSGLIGNASGTNIVANDFGFEIFPNPATSAVFLHFQNDFPVEIQVTTLDGRIVLEKQGENLIELPLSGMLPGMYLIRVKSGDKTGVQKLLKADR